jgi:hypothetical protein
MIRDQDFERLIRVEFRDILPSLIWQNDQGDYEAFGRYRIVPQKFGYKVFINDQSQGFFHSTRTDNMLENIKNDIFVRAGVANKSRDPVLKENIEIKLELKILHKKDIETQLNKCLNWAKYLQQKGFENETARSGHATTIKTNRSCV